jgi:hypothetical protein
LDVAKKTLIGVMLVVVLAVVPAAVGKGGATISFSAASVSVGQQSSPATVAVGQQYQVHASGFKPNTWVTVGAYYSDTTWWNSGVTNANGEISLTFTATSAGQIYHVAKEMTSRDALRVRATGTLNVTP